MLLSTREKLLIVILVALLLCTGLFFTVRSMLEYERGLERRILAQTSWLQKASALSAELSRLQRPRRRKVRTRSLIGYVEQLADRIRLKDRIQLNLIGRDAVSGLQGIDIKVDRLTLDEMVNLLYSLENADLPLVVNRLELSPSFRDKELLRLSMRVVTLD